MDATPFEDLTRALHARTRRRFGGLGAVVLASLGLNHPFAALAKCKKPCGPCQRCKKGKGKKSKCRPKLDGGACDGGTCQGGACLPPPPPPLPPTGPGSCPVVSGGNFMTQQRWAQTFLPPQGGQLTAAKVFLRENPPNFFLNFQIRTVDGFGVPANTVLANTTVSLIPQTLSADPPRQITGTFPFPATLTLGQLYALSVTAPITQWGIQANNTGNPCPDGKMFADANATGAFFEVGGGLADLVYAVTIV